MYWVWALSGPKELIPDVASALLGLSLVFKPPSPHIRPFLSCLVCGFWLTLFTFPLCLLPPSLLSEAELCVTHRCYKNWSKNEARPGSFSSTSSSPHLLFKMAFQHKTSISEPHWNFSQIIRDFNTMFKLERDPRERPNFPALP